MTTDTANTAAVAVEQYRLEVLTQLGRDYVLDVLGCKMFDVLAFIAEPIGGMCGLVCRFDLHNVLLDHVIDIRKGHHPEYHIVSIRLAKYGTLSERWQLHNISVRHRVHKGELAQVVKQMLETFPEFRAATNKS